MAETTRRIYVGTAGWSYKDWEGIVYPAQIKKSQHPVEYLARYIDVLEINTSFYGHIKPEWGKLWSRMARAVNPQFIFTAKLNRAFTHSPIAVNESTSADTIRATEEDERLAREGLESVAAEGTLGAVLAQFPISFKNTNANRDYLESVIGKFNQFPLVIEVRHNSWTNEGSLRYFAEKGVAFCNIDQPKLGKAITPTEHVTAPLAYVRLHGRNYDQWFDSDSRNDRYNYLYTDPELRGWKTRIDNIAEKAQKTFVIANNHFEGKAAVNALQLKNMITGRPVRVPDTLLKKYWELGEIAEPAAAPEATGTD
ncbi:MAG TPA: DUF72 domain-containing protein [Terriglobales bacterium]|jgi:uncharacterized protein YecE (DUF72 family)|nr:DUF72 domain-containing protein [Terriglobales bacterium]